MGPMTEAVLALLKNEAPIAEVARRAGVTEPMLRDWRDRFIAAGETALGELLHPAGSSETSTRQVELRQLQEQLAEKDRLIAELTNENRLLEKLAHERI